MNIAPGATHVSLFINFGDAGTGLPLAALAGSYARSGSAPVGFALAALANAGSAWTSGGVVEVDPANSPGLFRLDVPDAAFAAGALEVIATLKSTTQGSRSRQIDLEGTRVRDYAATADPQVRVLKNAGNQYRIDSDASGYVNVNAWTGGAPGPFVNSDAEHLRGFLGAPGTATTPTTGLVATMAATLAKLQFDAGNRVAGRVGAYDTNLSPGEQVLANPANKLATNGSGAVTPDDAGATAGAISAQATANSASFAALTSALATIATKTNQLLFTGDGFARVQVEGHATGKSPGEQVLAVGSSKLYADGSGNVRIAPATLAANALDSISVNGVTLPNLLALFAGAFGGAISYNQDTGEVIVSQLGNPEVVMFRFTVDASFQTRDVDYYNPTGA